MVVPNKHLKISVAICTYNGQQYLAKQIESILNQSIKINLEIIVCDDKSTDNTIEILSYYKDLYPTIFNIYINENNLGSKKNFEKAILNCTGDFIFLSDQDDIWEENKIEKILAVFNENPTAEGVFSNAQLIDEKDNPIKLLTIWDSVFFLEKELPKPIDFFNIISKNGNIVTGATLCVKSSIRNFIFPFTDDVHHDEKIASVLALRNSLFYSTENLISYRLHEKQQVGMKNINKLVKKNRIKRIILDLEAPTTFSEYKHLSKKIYLKLKKAKRLQYHLFLKRDIFDIIEKSHQEFIEINAQMKRKFPLKYLIVRFIDKLLGKRKTYSD